MQEPVVYCKFIRKWYKGSGLYKEVSSEKQCNNPVKKDGYCLTHHPEHLKVKLAKQAFGRLKKRLPKDSPRIGWKRLYGFWRQSMPVISDLSFKFLEEQYVDFVHEFFDDPDGMTGNDVAEMVDTYRQLQQIGEDVKKPFWETAKNEDLANATEYEINRLVRFLQRGGVNDIPQDILAIAASVADDD